MEYKIVYSKYAQDQLDKLSQSDVKIILKTIKKRLLIEPEKSGKHLRSDLKGYLKLKFSKYRVVYQVHKEIITVEIIACGLRKDIYENLLNKIK